jgi:hypothetical protein
VQTNLSHDQLEGEKVELRRDLDRVKETVGSALEVQSWDDVSRAMLDLHRRGRLLLLRLFNQNRDGKLGQAIELCRRACPTWRRPHWDADPRRPSTVTIRTDIGYGIPIELLPLFEFKPKPIQRGIINDEISLGQVAKSFLGFSAIVKRVIDDKTPPIARRLRNNPTLPLKLFQHPNLGGAGDEAKFFSNKAYFDLDGPWPNGPLPESQSDFAAMVAHQLWDPMVRFDEGKRQDPVQVLHFACHCDASADHPENYKIELTRMGMWAREYSVTLGELEDNLGELSLKGSTDRKRQPLIFLNACGSANLNPSRFGSFPQFFLDQGYLGFLGTEIAMPDDFAAAFSKGLYERLLQAKTLGEAIHDMRWEMLWKKNPLGILYSAYADPEIRVRMPVWADRGPVSHRPPLPNSLKRTTRHSVFPAHGTGSEPRDYFGRAKAVGKRFFDLLRPRKP